MPSQKHESTSKIVMAALELFEQRSIEAVSIDDIAKAAGTSQSQVHRVFGSKDRLHLAVFDYCWGEVNNHIYRHGPTSGGPSTIVEKTFATIWSMMHDAGSRTILVFAVAMYRRRVDLGLEHGHELQEESTEFGAFVQRLTTLCAELVQDQHDGDNRNPHYLAYFLVNYAATVVLSWQMFGLEALSTEEAQRGIRLHLWPDGVPATTGENC